MWHFLVRFYPLLRRMLFLLPPETAHAVTLRALQILRPVPLTTLRQSLVVSAFGLDFPNPLGLAAGFDKNAEATPALLNMGFGFVEVGGVTPLPQDGNPRPRLFRLEKDEALINRFGFNNQGAERICKHLEKVRHCKGILGVNIGANKNTNDKLEDYSVLLQQLSGHCDYITLNISSPNTPGLRSLQNKTELEHLLQHLSSKRQKILSRSNVPLPLALKIAPDLGLAELDDIAVLARQFAVDAIVMGNTTVSRPRLHNSAAALEPGGLSGAPLFALSTHRLAQLRQRTGPDMVLIGSGGIDSADAAYAKICAGANLLQLYTGLVFKGPQLIADIQSGLAALLNRDGYTQITDAVGSKNVDYARTSRI